MTRVYFQIGTNDGNDLFRQKVCAEKPDLVILVEPNPDCRSLIETNYKEISKVSKVVVYSNAIYYKDDELVTLSIPANQKKMGNPGENGITQSTAHFSLVPMNDWGSKDNMVSFTVKSRTLDTICKEHNIQSIAYLQIDTEGFDSEIIQMIDFTKYDIQSIRFEKWNFDSSQFTRHNGDKASELGSNGFQKCLQYLRTMGYTLGSIHDSDGNDFIATR